MTKQKNKKTKKPCLWDINWHSLKYLKASCGMAEMRTVLAYQIDASKDSRIQKSVILCIESDGHSNFINKRLYFSPNFAQNYFRVKITHSLTRLKVVTRVQRKKLWRTSDFFFTFTMYFSTKVRCCSVMILEIKVITEVKLQV